MSSAARSPVTVTSNSSLHCHPFFLMCSAKAELGPGEPTAIDIFAHTWAAFARNKTFAGCRPTKVTGVGSQRYQRYQSVGPQRACTAMFIYAMVAHTGVIVHTSNTGWRHSACMSHISWYSPLEGLSLMLNSEATLSTQRWIPCRKTVLHISCTS